MFIFESYPEIDRSYQWLVETVTVMIARTSSRRYIAEYR